MPDISIIIPCYNAGKFLPDAIESVKKYHGKYTCEIIIIDDGSTDAETLRILDKYSEKSDITILHQENQGAAAARNAGCKIAKGRYLHFLDSDNKTTSDYIQKAVDFLNTNPEFAVYYGKPIFFGDNSRPGFKTGPFNIDKLLITNYIDMCSFVRKSAFDQVGGFDESLPRMQDWDLWLSLYEKKLKFHYENETLFHYRIVQGSIGGQNMHKIQGIANIIRQKHNALLLFNYKRLLADFNYLNQSPEMKTGKLLFTPIRKFQRLFKKY